MGTNYKTRLLLEYKHLVENIALLDKYITTNNITEIEDELLCEQLETMEKLENILRQRLITILNSVED